MSRRLIAVLAVTWVLSLISVGVWAQSTVYPGKGEFPVGSPIGPVITGTDIGFQRVAEIPTRDGAISGKWMVKVNGQWVEARTYVGLTR
jgi:hypothetical protein